MCFAEFSLLPAAIKCAYDRVILCRGKRDPLCIETNHICRYALLRQPWCIFSVHFISYSVSFFSPLLFSFCCFPHLIVSFCSDFTFINLLRLWIMVILWAMHFIVNGFTREILVFALFSVVFVFIRLFRVCAPCLGKQSGKFFHGTYVSLRYHRK